MEVDNSCISNLDENTEDNQIERSNSTPGSTEQVTESGTASEYADVWTDFKCVFCRQDIKNITNPKLLPCLHTACESCLTSEANGESSPSSSGTELVKFHGKRQGGKIKKSIKRSKTLTKIPRGMNIRVKFPNGAKQVLCPICSQEINIDDAVDHLFLMEHSQNADSLPEESSYPCSCEEGNEGIAFCQECQDWLCDSCVTAHHRVRITKDHTVRPKEEMEGEATALQNQKYLMCSVHPKEQLKVYCETCDKLTCRDCQLTDHKAHKYQFLSKACEEEKEHITELLSKIKEKQGHMEEASCNLNKRHEEIVERENRLSHEIQVFGIKFITDINKRAKALLQDLNKICSDKKNLLNVRTQELQSVSERLKHCQKFAEAAVALGSETALVYSKKPIMNQLRRILRHKCDVPNANQIVDIQFNYETNFLSQYISSLGTILVDQQPIPGSSSNQNAMLPMPQTISQSPVPTPQPVRQVPQMQVNPRATHPGNMQQMNQPQQVGPYGQPQVTSSTDMVRNANPQMRQMMTNQMNYGRGSHVQRGPVPNQQNNFQMQPNANYVQRQMVHQQSPQTQMRQRPQAQPPPQQQQQQQQQQQRQQPQQQQQQQIQQPPPPYNNTQLPMPLRTNKNISVTTLPSPSGPSPSKQRAIAPRSNMTINAMNNQVNVQRTQTQGNQGGQNQPQLIVLDGENKTPNMSNTTRLTHFPSNLAATLAANPSLQIQPATNNNYSNPPPMYGQQISVTLFGNPPVSSMLAQSSPNLVQHLIQPSPNVTIQQSPISNIPISQGVSITPVTVPSYADNIPHISSTIANTNTSQSGYKLILPKQNQNLPPVTVNSLSTTTSVFSDHDALASLVNDIQTDDCESTLKQLLEKNELSCKRESNTPLSSSSDSLPSLDSLLNTSTLQNVTVTADDVEKSNTEKQSESVSDVIRNTDSNSSHTSSSELSSAFQKSCRTSEEKCTVCKEGKNVISCSKCPRSYHADCHVPSLSSVKIRNDWVCMMCRDVLTYPVPEEDMKRKLLDLQGRELLICERILLEVFIHPKSWPFHNKVSKKVPNYYKVIKRPMDLSTIRMKLSPAHFEHYVDVEAFCDDMRLIFQNCFIFNTEGSDVYNAGKEVQTFFEKLLSQYFPELTYDEHEADDDDE